MTTTTSKQAKAAENIFDADITSVYTLALPTPATNAYDFPVYDLLNEEEQYMARAFHQQYVAVEGRTAVTHLVNTRLSEIATGSSRSMGQAMENIERIETAASLSRLHRRFQDYNNKLLDQTARHMLETNAIAVRSMQEDLRRSIYKPPPPPPPPPPPAKRKGIIQSTFEILFGEL